MKENINFPEPPEHLSEKARALYRQYVGADIATSARIALFLRGLEALDLADECSEIIRRDGVVRVSERSGLSRQHPLLHSLKIATETVLKVWNALGLNSERGKIPWA